MNSTTAWILDRIYAKQTAEGAGAIKGDKGDKGDTGPQGPKGDSGSTRNVLDGKTICCIGDSFTEGTSGGFPNDTFEPLDNYSTVRTNQAQYRTYPWWIAKINPTATVKNFALGQSCATRGDATSEQSPYNKCFAIGTNVDGLNTNFSFQNIPVADVYFIQFGINDCQQQKNGINMGIKETLSITTKQHLERSFVEESYATDNYTTDFTNVNYIAATFAEAISAIINMCRIKNADAKIIWLISEWTIDHAGYNIIKTMCNFHGVDTIDMMSVNGSIATNRKDITIEGNYSATVSGTGDDIKVTVNQRNKSGVLSNIIYTSIDKHPNALAHEKKGKYLSNWLQVNLY